MKKYRLYSRVMPFYYFAFAVNAVYLGYFTVYLNKVGLSSAQIGIIMALAPLASLIGQPLWSSLERFFQYRKTLLYLLSFGAMISISLCGKTSSIIIIGLLNCCYSIFYYSIQPVGDAVILEELNKQNLPYGIARIAGVAGYSSLSALSGFLIGDHAERCTAITAILLAMIAFTSLIIPKGSISAVYRPFRSPVPASRTNKIQLQDILKNKSLLLLLLYGFAIMTSLTLYYNFYSLYFTETVHGSKKLLGFCYVISSFSEIPFFFLGDKFIHRYGAGKVLLFGGCIMSLRWLLIALFPSIPMLAATQILHFGCFAIMTVTIIEYINIKAPAAQKVTIQLFFSVITLSSAKVVGSLAGGFISKAFGYQIMYLVSFFFVFTIVILFALYQKHSGEQYLLNCKW